LICNYITRLHRKSLPGIPQPAELGDVDDDAVGTAQLDRSIAGALASARLAVPSCSFEGRLPGGPHPLHPFGAFEHVIDDEADVVKAHPVADRYRRMGALHLFCALLVATGTTVAQCFPKRGFADFKTFLLVVFTSAACQGLKVLHVILNNGSTHAPKQLAKWLPRSISPLKCT
jgi:hypothetical protein